MKALHVFTAVLLAATAASSCNRTRAALIVEYEPAVVELRGLLIERERFGPPNYGEDPMMDARVRIHMLRLSRPMTVRADTGNTANLETVANLREVQLLGRSGLDYSSFLGQAVSVRGTLARAVSGRHYTRVVMSVLSIVEAR
jgi:hypothetical protein